MSVNKLGFIFCVLTITISVLFYFFNENKKNNHDEYNQLEGHVKSYSEFMHPFFENHCIECHNSKKTKGELNLQILNSLDFLREKPEIIEDVIYALDTHEMPPSKHGKLAPQLRADVIASLKNVLATQVVKQNPEVEISRYNRHEYNYAIKDLFDLKKDVFFLPEKLITRYDDYLSSGQFKMPSEVNVASHTQDRVEEASLTGVYAYPKDHRAENGFDNQQSNLALSLIHLDHFFKLSVSILESPDFNKKMVGVWDELFVEPNKKLDLDLHLKERMRRFLFKAFKGNMDEEVLARYVKYVRGQLSQGVSYSESMKKGVAAVISSPLFLYANTRSEDKDVALAFKLSNFLWSGLPDDELLDLAASGNLTVPSELSSQIDRMLQDKKIGRFLSSFASQWLQLEKAYAASPIGGEVRYFKYKKEKSVASHMVLEPLLLFDSVFVENRPITNLIDASFSYRSELLDTWYAGVLQVPQNSELELLKKRKIVDDEIEKQLGRIELVYKKIDRLLNADESTVKVTSVDVKEIKPYVSWKFNRNLKDEKKQVVFTPNGKVSYVENGIVLEQGAYLESDSLPDDIHSKTFEILVKLENLDTENLILVAQKGEYYYDGLDYNKKGNAFWGVCSNNNHRSKRIPLAYPEKKKDDWIHLALVYKEDGVIELYRDGRLYGKPYRVEELSMYEKGLSKIYLGGLGKSGKSGLGKIKIKHFRFYDRALTRPEISLLSGRDECELSENELALRLPANKKKLYEELKLHLNDLQRKYEQIPQDEKVVKYIAEKDTERYEKIYLRKLYSKKFNRVNLRNKRHGGVLINAAVLTMTSNFKRTQPITRGAWVLGVVFNEPPDPPPMNVAPLDTVEFKKGLTIREKIKLHSKDPNCASCHSKLDPLGFALENFDRVGRWRLQYMNQKKVIPQGELFGKHEFDNVEEFKQALLLEKKRFIKGFISHLLRYALKRELVPRDSLVVDEIYKKSAEDNFKLRSIIRGVVLSSSFRGE